MSAAPAADPEPSQVVHLSAGGVSLVIDAAGQGMPRVVHWGPALGPLRTAELAELVAAVAPVAGPGRRGGISPIPEHSHGWHGRPGVTGHRGSRDWSTWFAPAAVSVDGTDVAISAEDPQAGLGLRLHLALEPSGLLRMRATLRNVEPEPFTLTGVALALPVPGAATEILDLAGRWGNERVPQRSPFGVGARVREGRRGRTGADASIVLAAGSSGFGFRSGEVWGIHLGWSGNHQVYAERVATGEAVLGAGELLSSGEVELAQGEEYDTPWLYASYGRGLDEVSTRFHRYLRSRPEHPKTPRPVTFNTWEAVYFDHEPDRLKVLAEYAAGVGAERYVLDDGWFRNRRSDRAGLGDWYVDETVWPNGLHPLVEHVRSLGMEFGLWVEPEMVNPDSDLARAHPDWILRADGRLPAEERNQQVLDLTNPAAYGYVLERLDALVAEYGIGYLKWDHNRDLVDAGSGSDGRAAVHRQTLATYRMLAELRSVHPELEIESCSSGGARVDLGILQHTDRVWASDCIDALDRQQIQRMTQLLLPPELVGAHIGAERAHTTGRRHDLTFRAGTALFGHLGVEWDIAAATRTERAELASWVALYKRYRHLLHDATVVRADHPDPAFWAHGVVSDDRDEAIFALVAMRTATTAQAGRVRLPGLDPERSYRVRPLPPGDRVAGAPVPGGWWERGGVTASGRVLAEAGLQAPIQYPEHLVLLHLAARDRPSSGDDGT